MFGGYSGQRSDLAPWLEGADLNRDGDLRLQYLAGWGINSSLEDFIYRRMASYRQPPRNIFTGSPQLVQSMLGAIAAGGYSR
jgi:spermidine synthase